MSACPANWQIINGVCIDNACPYGQPEAQAPGQANSCVQTSSGAPYYCSPELCYNNAVNTPQPSLATMPAPQTNNGTVTKKGCTGQVYIFSGQAMQCTRYMLGNCCSHSKFAFGEGTCNAQDQTIANAIVHDANDDTSPNNPVPVYSGSGGNFGPTIGECSQNAIDNDGCGQLGEATYIGSYCSNKILGMCLDTYTYVFCKFNGLLATLIQAQGRAQLAGGPNAISWGTCTSSSNCSPNCTGFTPAQFQMLNFANMNLSEFVAVMTTQVKATLSSGALTNQIQNTTMSVTNEVTQIEGASTP
jgi:conjugal transfer mating pair stabilization protein TraN